MARESVYCSRCTQPIPFLWKEDEDFGGNLNLALTVTFSGSYGEFIDAPMNRMFGAPPSFILCHKCGHLLEDFLGISLDGHGEEACKGI